MGTRGREPGVRVVDLLDLADRTVGSCLARASATSGISREQWRALMLLDEGVGLELGGLDGDVGEVEPVAEVVEDDEGDPPPPIARKAKTPIAHRSARTTRVTAATSRRALDPDPPLGVPGAALDSVAPTPRAGWRCSVHAVPAQ